jgi:hypothetical protein
MKKFICGIILFVVGILGFLVLSLFLATHRYDYNGITGIYAALLGNDLMVPYIIFCVVGICGIVILIYEAYFHK